MDQRRVRTTVLFFLLLVGSIVSNAFGEQEGNPPVRKSTRFG